MDEYECISLAMDTWIAVYGSARDALAVALGHRQQAIAALIQAEETCRSLGQSPALIDFLEGVILRQKAENLRAALTALGVPE